MPAGSKVTLHPHTLVFAEALLIQSLSLYSLQVMRESDGMSYEAPETAHRPRRYAQAQELCDAFDFRAGSGGKLLICNRNFIRKASEGAWR